MAKSLEQHNRENEQRSPEVALHLVKLADEIEKIVDDSKLQRWPHMEEGQYFVPIEREQFPQLIAQLETINDTEKDQIAATLTTRFRKAGWHEIVLTRDEKGWRKKTLIKMIVFLFKNEIKAGPGAKSHGIAY